MSTTFSIFLSKPYLVEVDVSVGDSHSSLKVPVYATNKIHAFYKAWKTVKRDLEVIPKKAIKTKHF
jgi:hypothetical protein